MAGMNRTLALALSTACLVVAPVLAQAPGLSEMNTRLRAEETNNSKAMWIMHEITDVYGPRLTGSPGLRSAQDFVVGTMKSWGLSNVHLEAWTFNHPGWENYDLEANVISPFQQPLDVRAVSWTPGTNGMVQAPVVVVEPPMPPAGGRGGRGGFGGGANAQELQAAEQAGTSPAPMPPPAPARTEPVTQQELDQYLASIKDKVKGAIIFYGPHVEVPLDFVTAPFRRPEESYEQQGGRRGGRGGAPAGRGRGAAPSGLTAAEITAQTNRFLVENGALVKVTDAGRHYGVIVQQSTAGYNENPENPNLPSLLMGNEDYGRIYRTVTMDHMPVVLRVNIDNSFYPSGKTVYNVVGELPGSDKADEVVMLGGHFDSWNPATGATDNGAGSTDALEAIRLLKAVGAKPRRTIRVVLWSGEEEGLYGSIAYVAQHFGSAEHPKPEYYKFDGYLNIDDGTSKPRAASVFGPPEAAAMVQQAMDQFKDWGFHHVNPTLGRNTGGTDSTSFNNAGLPGIGYSQDPFDYNTYTHHTNFDTYERIYEPDIRESAVEEALTAYALATADQMLPRCSAATMPPPPPARAARGGNPSVPVTPVAPFAGPPLAPGATPPAAPSSCTPATPAAAAAAAGQ